MRELVESPKEAGWIFLEVIIIIIFLKFKINHTYFNVAAGQISHFRRVSLLNDTDLERSNNDNSEKDMCKCKKISTQ